MTYNELKPCPFCGGEAVTIHGTFNREISAVLCKQCGVQTKPYKTPCEAIKKWNTRTITEIEVKVID